jgi:diguanylate cyclase (GGDEF)-like protein
MATPACATAFAAEALSRAVGQNSGMPGDAAVLPSSTPEGCFLPIPLLATLWHRTQLGTRGDESRPHDRRLSDLSGAPPIVGWIGLRFAQSPSRLQPAGGWDDVLEMASALASTYVSFYGILTDPVTGLPGRAELTSTLRSDLERAESNGLPYSLLFVRPENLDNVNERLGRQAGDAVLREFVDALQGSLRRSDTLMRFGGAVFALPLRDVASSGATVVGKKIRQRLVAHTFLDGTERVPFSIGIAAWDGGEDGAIQALDLVRRADQALSVSARDGRNQVVLWRADGDIESAEHIDPLLGVFTGQSERDYRNMRLLWDVLQSLSGTSGTALAEAVVGRMFTLFGATRAAIFEKADGDSLHLAAGRHRSPESNEDSALTHDDIEPREWRLSELALSSREAQSHRIDDATGDTAKPHTAFVVPLVIDGRTLGCLYLRGRSETLKVDQTDLPVLGRVAAQLALALDRSQLAEQQRLREQRERQLLKAEVSRLRTVLREAKFVFQSKSMADLLETTRRVASTDETVLITGESGTGKEMLAHTLHELSGRRSKPLVIVDCGAIPASLMDSELFGRERGAYTGAERRAEGRLALANGGTVFLDEIGELPLEVQAKLLRFVQERTITMVGGTRSQRVDVRIIAATNRPLEDDVRARRFREDLFHRLNVVRLRIPPLRERRDDVVFLARHFLEQYARQYSTGIRGLSEDAERRLEAHDWPGNVRELQNTIVQAVVLARGDVLAASDFQWSETSAADPGPARGRADSPDAVEPPPIATASPLGFDEAVRALTVSLTAEVEAAIASGARVGPPLGKWLARDLVLEAYEHVGNVAARASALLGLPESTFGRQLRRAQAEATSSRRPDSWVSVRAALADVLRATGHPSGNLLSRFDDVLCEIVVTRLPDRLSQSASLMGVSVPTMKRRLAGTRPQATASEVCTSG